MIEILPESEDDTLAMSIRGHVTQEDYDSLEPELGLRAERFDSFDVMAELTDIESLEPAAILADFRFLDDYGDNIGRMAVVTSETLWQTLSDLLGKPFGALLDVDVERFDDRVEAWKWLRS